jgi:phosphohistidine swiveling domain-containing protein
MDSDTPVHRWQGLGASPGIITGKARIIRTEKDFAEVEEQDILVARHATPALYPSLVRARAAVCETGGRLCHLAVLARELRKPCVTGIPGILDAIESGAQLRVDGARGLVELISPSRQAPVPTPSSVQSPQAMVPILQFGLFSAAFEYTREFFDLETAIRTAALVSLPKVFTAGALWDFAITKNQLLVAAQPLRVAVDTLVELLESGVLKSSDIHHRYLDLCAWHGWSTLSDQGLAPHQLRLAVGHYVTLNQMTWLACVVKEQFTKRYSNFLFSCLAHLEEAQRNQLFLDSLIMPDHSYILRSNLKGDINHVWSTALKQELGSEEHLGEAVTTTRVLAGNAYRQHLSALQSLKAQLSNQDFERVKFYISTLADLVDLTERKNTDLYRCGKALFGSPIHQEAIAGLFDISNADGHDYTSETGRRRIVEIVLQKLPDVSFFD